ncbi:unnamed protein product, partial [Pylaiella littoralis]
PRELFFPFAQYCTEPGGYCVFDSTQYWLYVFRFEQSMGGILYAVFRHVNAPFFYRNRRLICRISPPERVTCPTLLPSFDPLRERQLLFHPRRIWKCDEARAAATPA